MYHLPNVLIDYIYSFDDNSYYKRKFHMVMKEILFQYSWKCTRVFLEGKHNIYDIYYQYNMKKKNPIINTSQYILWVSKNYGKVVYVDTIKNKARK
jgi:hypothetical protein